MHSEQTAPTGSASKRIRRSPEAARAEIIRAAEAALAELSFNELTVDVLMQRTGMTRSSFYHYFSGLDELLAGLLEGFERDIVASVDPWLSGDEAVDPRQATLDSLTHMLQVFREHAPLVDAVNQAASGNPRVYRRWQTRVIGAFIDKTTGFIEKQVARGLSRVDDPARTANALIRMNSAVAHDNLTGAHPDTPEAVAQVLAGIWNSVLYGNVD